MQHQFKHGQEWVLRPKYRKDWPSEDCAWPPRVRVDSILSGLELCVVRVFEGYEVTGRRIQVPWAVFSRFYRRG